MMEKPGQSMRKIPDALFGSPRVVVRFTKAPRLSDQSDSVEQLDELQFPFWKSLLKEFPDLKLDRVFAPDTRGDLKVLTRRAMEMDPTYEAPDFDAFLYVNAPPETDLSALASALRHWDLVREAYVEHPGPDPAVNAGNNPRFVNQGHLHTATTSIHAEHAWAFAGGDGAGQNFIDLERGWTLNHEDLQAHGATLLHGTNRAESRGHGAAVLGTVCASDNGLGGVGIVPNLASVRVVSFEGSTIGNAISAAIAVLGFGDLLLIEAQVFVTGTHKPIGAADPVDVGNNMFGPVEAQDVEYEMIRLATAKGIVVVEVGGNGDEGATIPERRALNMDTYQTPSGVFVLKCNPDGSYYRDSGAIVVSAATSAATPARKDYAPVGGRINCFAWGENINTSGNDTAGSVSAYTTTFGGTSGAAAIVAGAALAIQGRAQQLGFRFSPRQMRAILSNPTTGTKPAGAETTLIGVMPDLQKIFQAMADPMSQYRPNLYVRDFVGDSGDPHTEGLICASPDIIVRQTAVVVDPTQPHPFGQGSGTEDRSDLSEEVEFGQDNYIYVRMRNRGVGSYAMNVTATVYWISSSTLPTPDQWNLVGTTTLDKVPDGNQLTVSPPIVWSKADVPATGHYCFVAVVGNPADPAPDKAVVHTVDDFLNFVRTNNNIGWRNFNVVDNAPNTFDQTGRGFTALPFIMPGAPDLARDMALELIAELPDGAEAMVEVPRALYERLNALHRPGGSFFDHKRAVGVIRLDPNGRTRLGDLPLPAKSRNALRLLVHIPDHYRNEIYTVVVRQIWKGKAVGRVTWQLGPRRVT